MSKVSARPKAGDDFFQIDDNDGGDDDDGGDGDDGGDNFSSDAGQKITLCARLVAR